MKVIERVVEYLRMTGRPMRKQIVFKHTLDREPNGQDYAILRRAVIDGIITCDETGALSLPASRNPLVNDFADNFMEALAPIEPAPPAAVFARMRIRFNDQSVSEVFKMIADGELRVTATGALMIAGG